VKYLFLLIFVLFSQKISYAEFIQFDFSLGRYLVDNQREIKVHFDFDLSGYSEKDFLVVPFIESGVAEIFNFEKNAWISYGNSIYDLPPLESEMIIRIKGLEVEKTTLSFQIFNLKTGEIYTTPEKTIWSKEIYSDYLQRLNDNLLANLNLKDEKDQPPKYYDSVVIENSGEKFNFFEKIINTPNKYLMLPVPIIFVLSVLAGYKPGFKNNGKRTNLDVETKTYGVGGKIHE
jgi:hypothetical protein